MICFSGGISPLLLYRRSPMARDRFRLPFTRVTPPTCAHKCFWVGPHLQSAASRRLMNATCRGYSLHHCKTTLQCLVAATAEWGLQTAHSQHLPTSLTKPPASVMRCFSAVDAGLWSSLSATAVPARPSTARESPAFATNSSRPLSTARTAVQPTCRRMKS